MGSMGSVATASKCAGFAMAVLLLMIAPASAQTPTAPAPTPAPAPAQDPAANDPDAASPPGQVYRLPLEDARGDAAPRRRTPRSGEGGERRTNPAPEPGLRSENGFGSSSRVPGAQAPGADDGDARQDGGVAGDANADPPGDELRAQRPTPPTGTSVAPGSDPTAAVDDEPSGTRVFLLLALALVIGAAIGLATRAARRRSHGTG